MTFPSRRTADAPTHFDVQQVCEIVGPECRVRLSGRITIDSAPDLRASLLQRLQSSDCAIMTVDLFDIEYIDTSGLATLVEILKAARTQSRSFRLTGLRDRPRYLLEATRLLHLFDEEPRGTGGPSGEDQE